MTEREPVETANLDIYGHDVIPWTRARDRLASEWKSSSLTFFVGTVGPDSRPYASGVGAMAFEGDIYFVAGARTRRARNLAANSACTISVSLSDLDLCLEGDATRVVDAATLEAIAAGYREAGWPVQVEGDGFTAPFSAPSAGPPPWHLYRVTHHTAFGVASAEPHGATRWRFST